MAQVKTLEEKFGLNRTIVALSVARLGDAIGNSLLFIVIPLYVAKLPAPYFHVSEVIRVGILVSMYGLMSSVLEPIMGSLIDRIGHHKLLVVLGLILLGGATLAYAWATDFIWLLVLRAVQGVGLGVTVPATMALMAVVTRQKTRGRSMGFLSAMRMAGFAVGPLVGGLLLKISFDVAFYAGAGAVVAAVVGVWRFVEEPEEAKHGKDPGKAKGPGFFSRQIWSPVVIAAGTATLVMASAFTIMTTLEKQFNQKLHESAFMFGLAFSTLTVARLLTQYPLGWVSDRWGRKPLIIIGLVVLAPATALLGYVTTTWELVALRAIQGLASGGIAAPALALTADAAPAGGEGRQMSIATLGFSVGLAIGPLIAGFLAGFSFALPFVLGGALCLGGAVVVWWLVPKMGAGKPGKAGER